MPVKPPSPRHTSEDLGNKLVISIPSLKLWFVTIYWGILFILWAFAEIVLLGILIFDRNESGGVPIPILIFIVIALTMGGGFMIYSIAWEVAGKEIIEVTNQSITIRRVALGLGSPKEYLENYIKELRVSSSNMNLNQTRLMLSYFYPYYKIGSLAFDYGAQTFRFGGCVDEAEAKQILVEIQQKYPQYKK